MSSRDRIRLDTLLVHLGIAESRDEAQRLVRRGAVLVDDVPIDKPGTRISPEASVRCRYKASRFVSRGGEKLEHAFKVFDLSVEGRRCADLGSSTGGFVDCLLQHGAKRVYAVDVGYGQLHERLRTDPRVEIMDRTNARYLSPEQFGRPLDVVTADLSFISLRLVLTTVRGILSPDGWAVVLVKPEFEIGRGGVGKGGIIRRPEQHQEVLEAFTGWATAEWTVKGLEPSPICGKDRNIEFLAWLEPGSGVCAIDVKAIVARAHERRESTRYRA